MAAHFEPHDPFATPTIATLSSPVSNDSVILASLGGSAGSPAA